jgi:hypothetical protein
LDYIHNLWTQNISCRLLDWNGGEMGNEESAWAKRSNTDVLSK